MALSIGELVGYVGLDTEGVEKGMAKAEGLLKGGGFKKAAAGAGLAAGALVAGSLVKAMNLEPGRDKIAAALDLTKGQADRAGKVAGKLYSDGWGESADDVNEAVESVMSSIKGMRTASSKDLEATTKAAVVFAQTMGVDVSKAAQVAGNMVYNGMAKNGKDAFDLLTEASSRVPKELREDVLDATDEYGQFFHTLGIGGPQAMDLLARGASKGMYGIDKAGDAIKEFTIRSTDMSASSKQAYKQIGLDAHDMANDILAGGKKSNKAFNQIIDGILGIKDPAKRSNTAIALFGTQMEDLGVKDVPKFLRSLKTGGKGLDDWKGATDRAGATLHDNAVNNIEVFKRHLTGAFVTTLGGKVLPLVTKYTGFLSKNEAVSVALAGAVGLLAAGVGAYYVGVVAASVATKAWTAATKLGTAAKVVATNAQWAWNIAMEANPIGLLIVAIVALVAVLVLVATKTKWGQKIISAAWHGIKVAAEAVGNFFAHTLPQFFVKAWNKVKSVTTGGAHKVVGFVKGIPGMIGHALGALVRLYTLPYRLAGQAAYDLIRSKGGQVVDWVRGIPGKLGALAGRFGTAGRHLLQGFIDGMKNAAGIIKGIAGNVWNTVRGLLNGAIDKINAALEFRIDKGPIHIGVNPPDIPHLRTGGRVGANQPGMAWIGDANEPESVLRDSQLSVLLRAAVSAALAHAGGNQRPDGPPVNVYQQPGESAEVLAERLWFITRKRG